METSETLIEQEQELVAALQRGEKAAVPRLVRRYGGLLYSVALRVTGNSEDAEEAVQDALLQAFRLASRFRGESAFQTWLVRIAINAAIAAILPTCGLSGSGLKNRTNTAKTDNPAAIPIFFQGSSVMRCRLKSCLLISSRAISLSCQFSFQDAGSDI